jgi:hypothetical protein
MTKLFKDFCTPPSELSPAKSVSKNHAKSMKREIIIPSTRILNVSLEILSVFSIMKMPAVQIVKFTKSGLKNSTKHVSAE